jgi:hypothetical protein
MMLDVQALRDAADEIEACGVGNAAAPMRAAADEIERLRSLLARLDRGRAAITCP